MFQTLSKKLKNRKGFTLIELIVVLAILGIILAIAVPNYLGVQARASEDADQRALELTEKAAKLWYSAEGVNESEVFYLYPTDDEYVAYTAFTNSTTNTASVNSTDANNTSEAFDHVGEFVPGYTENVAEPKSSGNADAKILITVTPAAGTFEASWSK